MNLKITLVQAVYIAFGYFVFCNLYFNIIPRDKIFKYSALQLGYHSVLDKYDWDETLRRHKKVLFLAMVYTGILSIFVYVLGKPMAEAGSIVFTILAIIGGKWVGPVKIK